MLVCNIHKSFDIGCRRFQIFNLLLYYRKSLGDLSLLGVVTVGEHTELIIRDLAENIVLIESPEQSVQLVVALFETRRFYHSCVQLSAVFRRAFLIYKADKLTGLGTCVVGDSDLLARISCVSFVEQILERSKLISFRVERVEVVVDGDIANTEAWEYQLGVLTDLDIVSAESREVFRNERCYLTLLHQLSLRVYRAKVKQAIL